MAKAVYEVRRLDSNIKGHKWWNTIKRFDTQAKALKIAKTYEAQGRRIQIFKVS